MTHPIHKYRAIAAKWDEILASNDGGKLRRPITAEECCEMILAMGLVICWTDKLRVMNDLSRIIEHLEKAKNGV